MAATPCQERAGPKGQQPSHQEGGDEPTPPPREERGTGRPVDATTEAPLHFGGLVVARYLGLSFSLFSPSL